MFEKRDKPYCGRCEEEKPNWEDHFYREKRYNRWDSVCKECRKAQSKAWRDKKREEGTLKEIQHQWHVKHRAKDVERWRRMRREYSAIERREQGMAVRGPWKKYRENGNGERLPIEPLSDYLKSLKMTHNQIGVKVGIDPGIISRIIRKEEVGREKAYATLDTIDRILTGLGKPHMVNILYPPE